MIHSKPFSLQPTLVDTILPDWATTGPSRSAVSQSTWNVRNLVLVVIGVLVLTLSSKVQIPFWPVPMTTQTLVLLAMSMAYGWRLATMTVMAYLFVGALGLPVFAGTPEKGIGLAYILGPTGGYLAGFLLAAIVMGRLAERGWDRRFSTTALAMLVGNAMLYIPGLLWLGTVIGFDKPLFDLGMKPFLLADVAKLIIAVVVFPSVWKMVKKTS